MDIKERQEKYKLKRKEKYKEKKSIKKVYPQSTPMDNLGMYNNTKKLIPKPPYPATL